MPLYNIVCSQGVGTLVEWLFKLFTFSLICISLSLIFTPRCLIKIISFSSLAQLWTFWDTWWNLWEHHDDWKNFNTVQINLKDGHQTKQSNSMGKWKWTTQCQGSCSLWRQGPRNGINEQMESDRFFLKNHYVALFWLQNREWFHLSCVFACCNFFSPNTI